MFPITRMEQRKKLDFRSVFTTEIIFLAKYSLLLRMSEETSKFHSNL